MGQLRVVRVLVEHGLDGPLGVGGSTVGHVQVGARGVALGGLGALPLGAGQRFLGLGLGVQAMTPLVEVGLRQAREADLVVGVEREDLVVRGLGLAQGLEVVLLHLLRGGHGDLLDLVADGDVVPVQEQATAQQRADDEHVAQRAAQRGARLRRLHRLVGQRLQEGVRVLRGTIRRLGRALGGLRCGGRADFLLLRHQARLFRVSIRSGGRVRPSNKTTEPLENRGWATKVRWGVSRLGSVHSTLTHPLTSRVIAG